MTCRDVRGRGRIGRTHVPVELRCGDSQCTDAGVKRVYGVDYTFSTEYSIVHQCIMAAGDRP